jgi:hypothetical protein
MQIFGRSGGELLPLLTNFSGELETAKAQLGSMPGVMDRANATFDSISDNLTVIKGKFLEFAAGLLEKIAPALELVTTLMTRIDTAAIGMKLGDVITGASKAMGGFSDALAAIKLGEFGAAFEITWASIKLQAADSINSIWANIKATIASSAAFMVEAFGPGSSIWTIIFAAFDMAGSRLSIAVGEGLRLVLGQLPGIGKGITESLAISIKRLENEANNSSNQIRNVMGEIPNDFIRAADRAGKAFDESLKTSSKLIETTKMEVGLQESKLKLLDAQSKKQDEMGKEFNMMNDVRGKSFDLPFNMMDHLKVQKEITKELKEQLSISQEMAKAIKESAGTDRRGSRIQEKFKEAMSAGDLSGADRQQRRMARNEMDQVIQKAFGGGDKLGKSVKDIAKDQGIDTFGKSSRELRKELADKAKERQGEMVPGKGGKPGEVPGQPKAPIKNPLDDIMKAVAAIQKLVEKIEPKLPTAALGV